jgi:hypothetical protein
MKNLSDERYKRVYRPSKTNADFKGTDYGQNPSDDVNSDKTSGPGYGPAPTASSPMWLMTSVEAMFLTAEAAARGWISDDPKTSYEKAVTESFVYLDAKKPPIRNVANTADSVTYTPQQTAAMYLSSTNPRIVWPTSGALQDMINVIAWQKYFALNGIQANETWTDYRRLGVVQPPLSLAPERGGNPIPRRLLYPSSEYNYNSDNVNALGTINQFTTKIFWDK